MRVSLLLRCFLFVGLLAAWSAPCATAKARKSTHSPVGQVQTVKALDSMLSYSRELRFETLRVNAPLTQQAVINSATQEGTFFLPQGEYVKQYTVDHVTFYGGAPLREEDLPRCCGKAEDFARCGDRPVLYVVHKSTDNTLYLLNTDRICGGWNKGYTLHENVPSRGRDTEEFHELRYVQSVQGVLHFAFWGPGKSVRLTHRMADGKILRFQGGEVEILGCDDKHITFKVLKPLDMLWD